VNNLPMSLPSSGKTGSQTHDLESQANAITITPPGHSRSCLPVSLEVEGILSELLYAVYNSCAQYTHRYEQFLNFHVD